jgi:hypothetical protein
MLKYPLMREDLNEIHRLLIECQAIYELNLREITSHNQYHVQNVVMYRKILNVKNMNLINMFEDVDHSLYEYDI